MIFHQASRYYIVKKCIDRVKGKEKNRILEIGSGCHFNLLDVFPQDEITFLDLNMPEELVDGVHCVKGDASKLEYENNSFDFSIGLDVLEHVPVDSRNDVIKNLVRVSRKGVLISFPIGKQRVEWDERMLEIYYRQMGLEPPEWLGEHLDIELPRVEEVLKMLENEGIDEKKYVCIYGSDSELMHEMMYLESLAANDEGWKFFFDYINQYYIDNVLKHDFDLNGEDKTKVYIYVSKTNDLKGEIDFLANNNSCEYKEFLARIKEEQKKIRNTRLIGVGEKIFKMPVKRNLETDKNRVNVILITYNHEKYIKQAIESIIMQKTNFKFNIIVADDSSTDNTQKFIKELSLNTKLEFVFLDNSRNLGIMNNYRRAFAECEAQYIAILEGDDFWTDEYKLQKMVDFMDEHVECSMVFNRYNVTNFDKGTTHVQPRITPEMEKQENIIYTGHDLAYDNLIGNFSTCMYRKSCIQNLPEAMFTIPCYDWLTHIVLSRMGSIGCLTDVMSTYRIHDKGVWSGMNHKNQLKDLISVIDVYDKFTEYEFHEGFQAHQKRLELALKGRISMRTVLSKLYSFTPPILVYIIKALIPPYLVNKIVSKIG
ncbi:MAG: glycosyltransferase [Lachnospiraceae bacterium]|nr:glycosyltransferase [Lachnospiraceae bacterium]